MSSVLDRIKQPEYTGENRCPPCTAVNVVIAVVLASVVGAVFVPAGVMVLIVGIAAIYVRGYLIPGTPELTKRYFPDWLLARFDKLEEPPTSDGATAAAAARGDAGTADDDVPPAVEEARAAAEADGIVDPETLLVGAGVVEECEDEDDLCVTDEFADAWLAESDALRGDVDAQRAVLAALFDRESVLFTEDRHGRRVASDDDGKLNTWVSEGAAVADLGAARVLADDDAWVAVLPEQRVAILKALRSFLPECPLCGGSVRMTEETVESCCRSWDVLAVRCADCEEHFLEINPDKLSGTVNSANTSDDGGVGAGFTQG